MSCTYGRVERLLVPNLSCAPYIKKNVPVTKLMYPYYAENSWYKSPLPTTAEVKIYLHLSQFLPIYPTWSHIVLETLKYLVGVQRGQSYFMGRRCLFSAGWPPFQWWYHDKNTLWGRCFIRPTSLAPHPFPLGWLNLNVILLLDQLRLA